MAQRIKNANKRFFSPGVNGGFGKTVMSHLNKPKRRHAKNNMRSR